MSLHHVSSAAYRGMDALKDVKSSINTKGLCVEETVPVSTSSSSTKGLGWLAPYV